MIRRYAPYGVPLALAVLASCGGGSSNSSNPDGGGSSSGASSSGNGSGGGDDATVPPANDASSSGGSGSGGSSGTEASTSPDGSGSSGGSGNGVLQYHKDATRNGFYVDGAFTNAALSGKTLHLDSTFDGSGIAGQVRASPLYVEKGFGGNPTFYVVDESDNVYAFDGTTGKLLKPKTNLGTGPTTEPCGAGHNIGIRGTPAIDTASGIMVLDAATGSGATVAKHTIYGLKISDLSTAWSLDVSTLSDPTAGAFSPGHENQRSAVLIVGGIAYVTYGGFIGDCGTYHGWVVGVPVATGTGAKAWATPSTESGIWAPGGAASDGTNVYVATGNPGAFTAPGPYNGWNGGFSLVRFQSGPAFSGAMADFWVAINDGGDQDLGGSGPLFVNPAGASPVVVQLGKDGYEYALDPTKALGGRVSPSIGALHVMNDEITCGPAWASVAGTTYVVMVGNNSGSGGAGCPKGSGELVVTKLDVTNKATPITMVWCANPGGGGSPIVTSSDGTGDAMVWTAGTTTRNDGGGGDNQLHAFDLATGQAVLAGSDAFSGVRHFTSPIVVHGRMILAGDTKLYAYKP
jgi:hypothetical protein